MPGGFPPTNSVECLPFSPATFEQVVQTLSLAPSSILPSSRGLQPEYLASYLQSLGACSLVVEKHYIDRNFIEEVGAYYGRCLVPTPNHCARIHAFDISVSEAELDEYLTRAATGDREQVESELQGSYLGFVVVRPLPSVPIGRTVLRSFEEADGRRFGAVSDHSIHVLGLNLQIRGLGFQQQDLAVAACATTALWSALQQVCRVEGVRGPTTSEVTNSAVRDLLTTGRPFPSRGLNLQQMSSALRHHGFPAEVLTVGDMPQHFMLWVNVYLRSGLPVVLGIENDLGGHAVTLVGYQREHSVPLRSINGRDVALPNLDYHQVYLHDDRLGPYAKATLCPRSGCGDLEDTSLPVGTMHQKLEMELALPGGHGVETSWVRMALVPVYPKLRTVLSEFISLSLGLAGVMAQVAALAGDHVGLELFFDRSGSYMSALNGANIDADRLVPFQKTIALSRYVAVSRWYAGEEVIADFVWDTTDRLRDMTAYSEGLIGVVVYRSDVRPEVIHVLNSLVPPASPVIA